MAWGLWNKIKNGFQKAGKVIRNVARKVTDKVIKPFKPMISTIATAINPALGAAVTTGMDAVERFSDEGWDSVGKHVKDSAQAWAAKRFTAPGGR
jgi:hypothetical protein